MDEFSNMSEKIAQIKSSSNLPIPPPIPTVPIFNVSSTMTDRLNTIQTFILSFDYNYSGKPFFKMKRSGGSNHIQIVSKQLMKAGLPIQCVEAVFLSAYLSRSLTSVHRIPLSFKSKFQDGVHRHIVTAVCVDGLWGALGISRRDCLMFKTVRYATLFELVEDFRRSYESVFHRLLTVYLGQPFPHSFSVDIPIVWRALKLRVSEETSTETKSKIDAFCVETINGGENRTNNANQYNL
jgi:hypothetical protein